MGILNVTPDSFYDGGRYTGRDAALTRAHEIVDSGAQIIDVGGQSYAATNVGVDEDEELRRIVPAIEALIEEELPVAISVDTYRARIVREVLSIGADVINDCSGLSDPQVANVVASFDAALVVMHLRGRLFVREPERYHYDDPVADILGSLEEIASRAQASGVARESIIVDPGLEFGKEPQTDAELLRRFAEFGVLGYPMLLAASRKSFMGRLLDLPTGELLAPSLAAAALGWFGGARIFRVHDVAATVHFLRMLHACAAPERRE